MNEAVKEVVAQNLVLGVALIALVPLIKIAPSLLATIREWKSLRTLLKDMTEAQEASDKFRSGNNHSLHFSSQEYLKAVLYPKFRNKVDSKVDREIRKLMPKRYRTPPHSLLVVAIMATFATAYWVTTGALAVLAGFSGRDIQYFAVTPIAVLFGILAMMFLGNKFEVKIIPNRYSPKYFEHRVKALQIFNKKHGLNSSLFVRNGPRFDRYMKQENGAYVLVNEDGGA